MSRSSRVRWSLFLVVGLFPLVNHATGIQWSGQYRAEAVSVEDPTLGETNQSKRYGLHHLSLRPEIAPADGVIIRGQVEVFNSDQHGYGNTLGEFWGGGSSAPVTGESPEDSYVLRSSLDSSLVYVSQLYMKWFQGFGVLTVGRAPLDFGLGMSYSAGDGMWDHWMTTRDLLSYSIQVGNFQFTPAYGKLREGRLQTEDDVNEYLAELLYENVDTGLSFGAHYRARRAGRFGNDVAVPPGYTFDATSGGYEENQTSFFFQRLRDTWRLGMEMAFVDGTTGLRDSLSRDVKINSFGLALELDYKPTDSKWQWQLKSGLASGDDPGATDVRGGFVFDRNYDVSLLMFNHVLGARGLNLLGTAPFARRAELPAGDDSESLEADVESISNVVYFSPRARYAWTERFHLETRLTTGFLQNVGDGFSKDLGYELNLIGDYVVNSRFTWRNGLAFLFPGESFTGVDNQYSNGFRFGWISQAAIQF